MYIFSICLYRHRIIRCLRYKTFEACVSGLRLVACNDGLNNFELASRQPIEILVSIKSQHALAEKCSLFRLCWPVRLSSTRLAVMYQPFVRFAASSKGISAPSQSSLPESCSALESGTGRERLIERGSERERTRSGS